MQNGGNWVKVPLLSTAYLMYQMRKEYRIAGMPHWLQDVLLGLLASIAKLIGVSKKYPLPATLEV